jgi:hypothetical protein
MWFCHSWYQSCRFTLTTAAALKNIFRIKTCLRNKFSKYVGFVKVGA